MVWRDKREGEKCNYTLISKKIINEDKKETSKQMTESLDPVS